MDKIQLMRLTLFTDYSLRVLLVLAYSYLGSGLVGLVLGRLRRRSDPPPPSKPQPVDPQ